MERKGERERERGGWGEADGMNGIEGGRREEGGKPFFGGKERMGIGIRVFGSVRRRCR